MKKPLDTDLGQGSKPAIQQAVIFLLFVAGYFVLGMAGLQMQSAQTGASIGLAELTPDQSSPEDALHDADTACYEAKRAGRNRVWVHSGGGEQAEA